MVREGDEMKETEKIEEVKKVKKVEKMKEVKKMKDMEKMKKVKNILSMKRGGQGEWKKILKAKELFRQDYYHSIDASPIC